MKCAWDTYINLVPLYLRQDVDRLGKENLEELRLRIGRPPELIISGRSMLLDGIIVKSDLEFVINIASRYSPWTSSSIKKGYITAPGGHRVGICGEVVMSQGCVHNIATVTSVCLRVARDFIGIGEGITRLPGSILIIGSPGSGKTTLLRDIIRTRSNAEGGLISVVDERREIFPMDGDTYCFDPGLRTDILSGCNKLQGIEMVLRTMNPSVIAVDEITAKEDCDAIIHAAWCGIRLIATVHAENRRDLMMRPLYEQLLHNGIFRNLIIVKKDKSWSVEKVSE